MSGAAGEPESGRLSESLPMSVLTPEQARTFYDRFGRRQDSQAFYEDPALDAMLAAGQFETARSVFEFGCGTGRLAERLVTERLPSDAVYTGIDISPVMIGLARQRLETFDSRVSLHESDGSAGIDMPSESCDRFVSTYVLDLLSEDDVRTVLEEAHRILSAGGRLCLTGLTAGFTPVSRCVTALWSAVHRIRPQLVGGCRPVRLDRFLDNGRWHITFQQQVAPWGIPSQIVVAEKTA